MCGFKVQWAPDIMTLLSRSEIVTMSRLSLYPGGNPTSNDADFLLYMRELTNI